MDVIALTGKSNCGKTETLNIVYQFLLQNGYVQIQNPIFFKVLGNPVMRDFIDILEKGNRKVGIVTVGDYVIGNISIQKNLAYLDAAGCNIAITACTTKNPKAEFQVKFYPNSTLISKISTNELSKERIENYFYAQKIINSI